MSKSVQKRQVFRCCPISKDRETGEIIVGEHVSQRTTKAACDADRDLMNSIAITRYITREFWV